tara:strand:- start:912 stop:1493 length:582 start_codon:yes stop_codon:yes gene_type:complete
MIYVVKCQEDRISIPSLKINLNKGDSFECPKRIYETNREIKTLVSKGVLSSHPKLPVVRESKSKGLVARVGVPKVARTPPQPKVVHKTEVHHHENLVDLDDLASKLLDKLRDVLSPEIIAKAVASQLPQVVQQSSSTQVTHKQQAEEMTFIPSKILSDDVKSSSASTVSETSGEDTSLSDAMAALKAMRKAQK